MKHLSILYCVTGGALLIALSVSALRESAAGPNERGRYLVESVAMCVQCHTARDEDGKLSLEKRLMGAAIPVTSPFRSMPFAVHAPRIAGMPGYTKEQGVRLLTEGIDREGVAPQAPMPPFRMSKSDAEDVVNYLMSLK
jgi:mono/diheme cytochrome c family protein